jgi:hypothetical protein
MQSSTPAGRATPSGGEDAANPDAVLEELTAGGLRLVCRFAQNAQPAALFKRDLKARGSARR